MDEYIFHHFLIVIIGENERDRHHDLYMALGPTLSLTWTYLCSNLKETNSMSLDH